MKKVVQTGIRQLELSEGRRPSVEAPDDVILRVESVGICGSDIHYWEDGRIGSLVVEFPFVLGHEASGIVVETGPAVHDIPVGTRAAFEPGVSCGKCECCLSGRYNLCSDVKFLAAPPVNGAFQHYIAGKASQILPVPESISFEEAALLEPYSIGVYAVRRSGFRVGDSALVIGAGPIGLSLLATLKAAGAGKLMVTEKLPYRLEFAEYLGLDRYIDVTQAPPVERVMDYTRGRGMDFVFDASGDPKAVHEAISMTARGGTAVLLGICETPDVALPMHEARIKEVEIKMVRREARGYTPALDLVTKGLAEIDRWVTHRYHMDEMQEAFETVSEKRDGVIKAVLNTH